MTPLETEIIPLHTEHDIVQVRQRVRLHTVAMKFSLVDQTKMITAASELARNQWIYGGGGEVLLERLQNGQRQGLKLIFKDNGPGIADISQALRDGYTSGKGMGLGLGGAKRLVNEFDIRSKPGEGTQVTIIRWK